MTGNEDYGRSGTGYTSQQDTGTGELSEKARQKASEMGSETREQVRSRAEDQKYRTTEGLGNVAHAIRRAGDELRNQNQGTMAHYTEEFAGQIDRLSHYLQNKSVSELMHDAERFARREPGLFLGAAFALGLMGARFFKSSSPDRGYGGGYGYGGYDRDYGMGYPEYGTYREGHYYPPTDYGYQYNTRGTGYNAGMGRGDRGEMERFHSTGQLETDIPAATNEGGSMGSETTTGMGGTGMGTTGQSGMGTRENTPYGRSGSMRGEREEEDWRDEMNKGRGKL